MVDGKEEYKRSTKYCPKLDQQGTSNVECVVALDRSVLAQLFYIFDL